MNNAHNTNPVTFTNEEVINIYIGSVVFYLGLLYTVVARNATSRVTLRNGAFITVSHIIFNLEGFGHNGTKLVKFIPEGTMQVVKLVAGTPVDSDYINATLAAAHARHDSVKGGW